MEEQAMNFYDFLTWIVSAGGAAILFSWIVERIKGFQTLTSQTKFWITLVGTVILAVGAWFGMEYIPPEVFEEINPLFKIIYGTIIVFLGKEFAHALDKNRSA